jgi:outer membrane lipoprotein-sorting protein
MPIVTILIAAAVMARPYSQDLSAAQQDVLARSRAVYAALKSYSDTGRVQHEFGPAASPGVETHTFRTFYRAPRHYFFDFVEEKKAGGDRHVVWSDDNAFYAWQSVTGVEMTFPKGQGAGAFAAASVGSLGSILKLAPLLFPQAGLQGTLTEVSSTTDQGFEVVDGRRCHKLSGIAKSVYRQTGHETNVRQTTVWIDAETLLIRKVLEDTPSGGPAGYVLRYTTTFDPQANPTLDDLKFRFVIPAAQK